jgi:hypothetical protein
LQAELHPDGARLIEERLEGLDMTGVGAREQVDACVEGRDIAVSDKRGVSSHLTGSTTWLDGTIYNVDLTRVP